MTASRYLLALAASVAITSTAALAGPPGGVVPGVGGGANGGIGIGAPPIGVPPVQAPPVSVPPVSVPKPQTNAPPVNTSAHASASANASTQATMLHGTLMSVNGTTVTLQLSNGMTQQFTVSAQAAAHLSACSCLHKVVAVTVQKGTIISIAQGVPPLHASLVSVSGTTATFKLANGTTQTYTVTAQQAAWLRAHVGKQVAFWANSNGTIALNQSAHRSSTSQRSAAARHSSRTHRTSRTSNHPRG
jgi:hypothetical protein